MGKCLSCRAKLNGPSDIDKCMMCLGDRKDGGFGSSRRKMEEKSCNECESNGLEMGDACVVGECEVCERTFYLDCTLAVAGTCGCCVSSGKI